VGFFSPVEKALRVEFEKEFDSGVLVFLGTASPRHTFNFHKFKSQFFQAASLSDPDPVLVIAADMRGLDWVKKDLSGIVEAGRERGKDVQLVFFADAQAAAPVADALREFGLSGSPEDRAVSAPMLLKHTKGEIVLCVRGEQQPTFEDALRRANFRFARFEDHFREIALPYGPNVGKILSENSKRCGYLLYAWGELKYMQPSVTARWKAHQQGDTPAAAVVRFKQAIVGQCDKDEGEKRRGQDAGATKG
jgi:hypothetical protein